MLQDNQDRQTAISTSKHQSESSPNEVIELSLEDLLQITGGRRGGCGGRGCGGRGCGGRGCGGRGCGGRGCGGRGCGGRGCGGRRH
ncbi:hypothetical protein Cylst_0164 [Cylindrospermum stagnale PCC 7417]|uniref:Uncharacterized protein n=1 Tax=Cylindrospermum stagnale PCC 7417 TaxID=56107 RepID=K9WRY4_9NOST|nr:hypothetical protein Cylst_0164 [Cylindrospermum stagnale PCC 7417]